MALTDVFSYQKTVMAPVSGKVVDIVDSLSNQAVLHPLDTIHPNGNKIVLLNENGYLVQLSHLSKNSIKVNIGDQVLKGQAIAQCGSSGNSPWPLLSVQVNHLKDKNSVPFVFENITLNRWGFWQNQAELFLLRNDIIQAISKE
jgi:murein DD-endopeptidase MepM/ murein hydrolase activator NlpD